MTCIVAMRNELNRYVVMGGDSAGVSGLDVTTRADEKVFNCGPFILGFTSSFRMGQLLRYSLTVPKQKDRECDYKYMVTTFIDAVRKCLKDGGYLTKKEEVERIGTFLVGYRGNIYCIQNDLQVGQSVENYDSIGCGMYYALGALNVIGDIPDTHQAVQKALETAEKFSGGVRGPFLILEGGAE